MTPRQARRSLGTRSARRRGTKAVLLPGKSSKGPAGRKNRRHVPSKLSVLVRHALAFRMGGLHE